jgi:hypothetical protein
MDPGTGLTILGSAIGGARLVEKMLGPTAEYIGEGIKNWTERRVNNVARIFSIARDKLGKRIEEPGAIPPRVLKEILDEGSFCDDPLTAEYFGGVLASSRSDTSRDDRGVFWASLVTRLSSYQVRSHFLVYRAIYERFARQDIKIEDWLTHLPILLPFSSYIRSMEFSQDEIGQIDSLLAHSFYGLNKEGLVENFHCGSSEFLKKIRSFIKNIPEEGGIFITPSVLGIELFLWAHGHGNQPPSAFFRLDLLVPDGIQPCTGVLNIDDLKEKKSE